MAKFTWKTIIWDDNTCNFTLTLMNHIYYDVKKFIWNIRSKEISAYEKINAKNLTKEEENSNIKGRISC